MVHRWVCDSTDSSCVEAPAVHNPHCGTSRRKHIHGNVRAARMTRNQSHRVVCAVYFYTCCTLKHVGHMVMLTSGSRERKYSHLSGLGQRLIRTSLLLMERSAERLTLTGTKFEPPCCLDRHKHIHLTFWILSLRPVQLVLPSWRHINHLIFLSYLEAHFGCKWVFFFIIQAIIYA